jgi:hypothetical protein
MAAKNLTEQLISPEVNLNIKEKPRKKNGRPLWKQRLPGERCRVQEANSIRKSFKLHFYFWDTRRKS